MKLLNQDFKKVMKGYKAIKTICKSAKITFCGDETVIQAEDVELSYGHEQEHEEYICLTSDTLDIMEKCSDDFILSHDSVKSNTKTITHQCEDEHDPFIMDIPFTNICDINQDKLLSLIKGVSFATSKDEVRPVLQNILWDKDNFVAVDGYRVVAKKTNINKDVDILLTPKTYKLLEKLLDKKSKDQVRVFVDLDHTDKQYVAFEFGDITLITLLGTGNFLEYGKVYADYNLSCEVNVKELMNVLEFVQQDKEPVRINLSQDKMILSTQSTKTKLSDEITIELEAENHAKPELLVGVNPKFMIESLKHISDEVVKLKFTTSIGPITIEHSDGKDLILPINLKG